MSKLHHFAGATAIAASVLFLSLVHATQVAGVLEREAMTADQASHRVLLGLAHAGGRIVAVGERGLIVLSDDGGKTWRQAKVPVSITLTAVAFPSPRQGWAVGHSGIVLHTADGGETWSKQLDGVKIIKLLAEEAKAQTADAPQAAVAQQFVADGPDKPFLDLQFQSERSGVIVGAYGLILRTDDGGNTWQSLMAHVDNPKGLHIYAVSSLDDTIYLAGEQGLLARSDDAGKTFIRLATPYRGSFFTLTALPSGEVIIGGLKGNVFWSSNRGMTFQRSEGFLPISLSASAILKDGKIVFTNQAGQLFVSDDKGRSVQLMKQNQTPPLSAVLQTADGNVIGAGIRGITRVSLPASGGQK